MRQDSCGKSQNSTNEIKNFKHIFNIIYLNLRILKNQEHSLVLKEKLAGQASYSFC